MNAMMTDTEWRYTLDNLVNWANGLDVSPGEAFNRIVRILKSEHFGIAHCSIDNFDDVSSDDPPSMIYLNMGETYATTLILTDDYKNGVALLVSSWGDWYEEQEAWIYEQFETTRCGYCSHFKSDEKCDACGHCE